MRKVLLLFVVLAFPALPSVFSQTITPASNVIYVKKGASGNGSGSSWTNAVPELADALKWARDNQAGGLWNTANPLQIWVAKGTYKPLYTHNDAAGNNPPMLNSFVMVRDVAVYGGFAGTETATANRTNWKANKTVLSGELEMPYIDEGSGNSYPAVCHVVVAAGPVGSAVLDGFTVTGGRAELWDYYDVNGILTNAASGGGIYLAASYPVLRNLDVTDNISAYNGAGLYMQSALSTPAILNLSGISFTGNTSENRGGGIYLDQVRLTTHNCTFLGNISLRGAALYSNFSYLTFVNTVVAGNHANEKVIVGGQPNFSYAAIYPESSNLDIINSTISANKGGSVYTLAGGNVTSVKNSIINNHNYSISGLTESKITNSIVQFITTNNGSNLAGTTNPQFVSGRTYNDAPFTNGDYRLKLTSPVVDKGANASYPGNPAIDTDPSGRPRLTGTSIDMGAFEGGYDPLPVNMTSFRAEKEQIQVLLKWGTVTETNASGFEVQRSLDGKTFTTIGMVQAKGESDRPVHYQFPDYRTDEALIYYYRIRTIDKDGSFELSRVISVKWDDIHEITGRIYPNPTDGTKATFDFRAGRLKADIAVFDLSGRRAKVAVKENPDRTYELEVHELPKGLYIVKAVSEDGETVAVCRLLVK